MAALTPGEAAGDLDETQLITSSDGMAPVNGIIAGCSMFLRMIDDFKNSTGTALRLTSLAALAALALLIATSFLCAGAFVFVFQKYGLIEACLTGAGIFFVVTLIAAASYMVRRRLVKVRAEGAAKSAAHTALADPMLVAAGIQIVRAVGIKRLIPILLVGGLALVFLASRSDDDKQPKE